MSDTPPATLGLFSWDEGDAEEGRTGGRAAFSLPQVQREKLRSEEARHRVEVPSGPLSCSAHTALFPGLPGPGT